jgi:hypothetical protein
MKNKILFWITSLVILGVVVYFINPREEKTAGWYLDSIVELRQQKQILTDEIKLIDEKIIEYRSTMDKIQYSWLDYMNMGLIQETQSPERNWTWAEELLNQYIE